MAKTMMICSNSDESAESQVPQAARYFPCVNTWLKVGSSEAIKQDIMGRAGTLSNMSVRITVNTNATFGMRMRIDGANGNQVISILSTTGYFEDNSNTDVITDSSKINYRTLGRFGNTTMTLATVLFDDDESTYIRHAAINIHDLYNSPPEYYALACNASNQNVVKFNTRSRMGTNGTFIRLRVHLSVNSRGGVVARLRINGNDGNLVISTSTVTTGSFEDNSNTDEVDGGDLVNYSIDGGVVGGGSNDIICDILSVGWTNDNKRFHILSGLNLGGIQPTFLPAYLAIGGAESNTGEANPTEANVKSDFNISAKISKLFVNVGGIGDAGQLMIRKNGADTDLFINVEVGSNGILANTVQSVELVSANDLSIKTTVDLNMAVWGMLVSHPNKTVFIRGAKIRGAKIR